MTPVLLDPAWWRHAAIYQVYVRSFADGDGDGVGDLAGVRARLPFRAFTLPALPGSEAGPRLVVDVAHRW